MSTAHQKNIERDKLRTKRRRRLGFRVRVWRVLKGLTLAQAAHLIGVGEVFLHSLEFGHYTIQRVEDVEKVLMFYGQERWIRMYKGLY